MRTSETSASPAGLFEGYDSGGYFCELFGGDAGGRTLPSALVERLQRLELRALKRRAKDASQQLMDLGITFTVYSDRDTIDRVLPFDPIPRILSRTDWDQIERGVKQRVAAINAFLDDVYNDGKILRDGAIPAELIKANKHYLKAMEGFHPPGGVYAHIAGIDLVRDGSGEFRVLEDNARTPSGVSYVVENRHLMMRAFPDLAEGVGIANVDDYGARLMQALSALAPGGMRDPCVALLSPGVFNSAYFEHVFLAREMGATLVEGRDLVVQDDCVFMRTTDGLERVDVIYRRIDDDFLDPQAFRSDSMLGAPGLFAAYKKGHVTLANAPGAGVADDKAVYAYMPRIIEYYLGEDPIIANVDTHICREPEGLAYTLDHLDQLVTKPVGESGGYGVVIGPRASNRELAALRRQLKADPSNYISQPMVDLSVSPTLAGAGIGPRHVDLRPFAVTGRDTWVLPGGLTRVAMRKGSLVVNSSQGGGSKDTWVLA
ncbi:MAG: circularly permuted type 2 ATP-grasp protein [Pseudomonadota bacterium]